MKMLLVLCMTLFMSSQVICEENDKWVRDKWVELEYLTNTRQYDKWVECLSVDYRSFIESKKCLEEAEIRLEQATGLHTKITTPQQYFYYVVCFARMDGIMLYVDSEILNDSTIYVHYRQKYTTREYGCYLVLENEDWKFDLRGDGSNER